MCGPPAGTTVSSRPMKVVVVGAGPAGLLTTIKLLRRNAAAAASSDSNNAQQQQQQYHVTIVDPGPDYGRLNADQLSRKRSWMIGLSSHGADAIKTVPGLYEDYVKDLGIDVQQAVFQLSKRIRFEVDAKDFFPKTDSGEVVDSSFTVDRNFICAALARYLYENFDSDTENYEAHYKTRALFVDDKKKRVLVRNENKGENGVNSDDDGNNSNGSDSDDFYLDYDLLIGCDGIRSVVRNAMATANRDFEYSVQGTFSRFKAVHVQQPPNVKPGTFMFLKDSLPNMVSFVLAETGNKLNVAFGINLDHDCADELLSDDVNVVRTYMERHFTAFDLDCQDAAQQWVDQTWNTTGQVHCNTYHSLSQSILIMGDAAHGTSPAIGQGMNTALADAAVLDELLDTHKDNVSQVLPAFSELRVKEGNALTDLSFYTFSLSGRQQFCIMLRENLHRTLNKIAPWLIDPYPTDEVSSGGKLSVAYDKMSKLGIIQRTRYVNDKIMQEHFERETGMVVAASNKCGGTTAKRLLSYAMTVAALSAATAMYVKRR